MSEASEMFRDVLCRYGGYMHECVCGRFHFAASDRYDWEDGQLESLLELHKAQPEKYIQHDEDAVSSGEIDGCSVVFDCVCNTAAKYENFIWAERKLIMEYLVKRTSSIFSVAKSDSKAAQAMRRGLTTLEQAQADVARLQAVCKLNGYDVTDDVPIPF